MIVRMRKNYANDRGQVCAMGKTIDLPPDEALELIESSQARQMAPGSKITAEQPEGAKEGTGPRMEPVDADEPEAAELPPEELAEARTHQRRRRRRPTTEAEQEPEAEPAAAE